MIVKKDLSLIAHISNLHIFLDQMEEDMLTQGVDYSKSINVSVACEEIFTNICSYAYQKDNEEMMISYEITNDEAIQITFIDSGIAFNPLEYKEPDISQSADERKIGGLGIFIVKNSMDELNYSRIDGKNIFTIKKYFK